MKNYIVNSALKLWHTCTKDLFFFKTTTTTTQNYNYFQGRKKQDDYTSGFSNDIINKTPRVYSPGTKQKKCEICKYS